MRWGREDEGLGKSDKDLAYHDQRERWRGTTGTGIAEPITKKDQDRRGDYCATWAAGTQSVEGQGGGNHIGKEEDGAQPVYDARGSGEEGCGCVCDRRIGEPLSMLNLDRNCTVTQLLTSQLTIMFRRMSWARPNHLLL